jgi:hypothetical protein
MKRIPLAPQSPEAWEPLPTSYPRRIVCAAWMHLETGQIILCVRHSCPLLYAAQDANGGNSFWKGRSISGFVDQYGKFHDRESAWKIAEAQGQIIRQTSSPPGTLYSENLY